ncbi:DUF488 domain-containing protein [Arthrobacter sunyaminii]|uniref:DUF488 family protein n=1 Tax=Arthrobacter sunyaminii TaxID=2816859 RepID=A0A975PCD8_9MICC|nr:DUF488 family protein [Arthrobacter sunyaminii]MBO0907576.1 DUF488 family protein [Arthrobacter sunyaminii]QWQ35146.1 DUF488 family protein [Arthrobacter sunyaminii]
MATLQEKPASIRIRRIYEPPDGGYRVLVDRLWPRGVSKARAELDEWLKDLAPSNDLRKWFGHREDRWTGFQERYREELAANPEVPDFSRDCASRPDTVLLYGARSETENEAVVLRDYLLGLSWPGRAMTFKSSPPGAAR